MSYYPLIDLFCQFLKEIINYIKIKRIEDHSKNPYAHEEMDIKSFVERMENVYKIVRPLYSQNVEFGTKLDFQLGEARF
jgi:hypothetical protein